MNKKIHREDQNFTVKIIKIITKSFLTNKNKMIGTGEKNSYHKLVN